MDDDLSRLTEALPKLIWFPYQGSEDTYGKLARLKPQLVRFIARACVVANYQALFDELDPRPRQ